MIAACKLLTNHIHTQLLRHSWQLPIYYWQKQNESFPVDTRFPDLLQQGKGAEMVFQLMPSETNWRWGHKLPFPKIWKLPINTKILSSSYSLWLLLCLWKGQFEKIWNFQRKVLMGTGAWGGIRSQTTFQSVLTHLCLSLCSSSCNWV